MKLPEVIVIVVVLICATVLTALGDFNEAIAGFFGLALGYLGKGIAGSFGLALGYLGKGVVGELKPSESWKPGP